MNKRIVIHLKRRQLALFDGKRLVASYPIAIGKPTTPTPVGTWRIKNKQLNPGGPYGSRWLGLSAPNFGIHGTNNPASIGKAVSDGCIRLHNANIESIFPLVSVGTPVTIQND